MLTIQAYAIIQDDQVVAIFRYEVDAQSYRHQFDILCQIEPRQVPEQIFEIQL